MKQNLRVFEQQNWTLEVTHVTWFDDSNLEVKYTLRVVTYLYYISMH